MSASLPVANDCCDSSCVGSATVEFLSLGGWFRVESIVALREIALVSTNVAAFVADGGFTGFFWWDNTSSAADNGTTVIKPDDAGAAAGRWIKAF